MYSYTPRSHRIPPNRNYAESDMILPTLVAQVLRNVCGNLVDVQATPIRGETAPPENLPAIRIRPRGNAWAADGRMSGRMLVVSFVHGSEPLIINPRVLVDPLTGDVLPEYMTGLPGVSMKLRTCSPMRIGNQKPHLPSYAAHYWSAIATLGGAA